jgi:hypothetical protein
LNVTIVPRYSLIADTYFWLRGPCDGGPADLLRDKIAAVIGRLPRQAATVIDPIMASHGGDLRAPVSPLAALPASELAAADDALQPFLGARLSQLVTELAGYLAASAAPPASRRSVAEGAIGGLDLPALASAVEMVATVLGFVFPAGAELPISVTLVADGVELGGVTGDVSDRQPACFVSVAPHPGSTLAEVIVHEATHAIDILCDSGSSLVHQLRREAGAHPQLWHATFFLAAAAAVRRHIESGHEDFGSTHGYYAKVPAIISELQDRGIAARISGAANGTVLKRQTPPSTTGARR